MGSYLLRFCVFFLIFFIGQVCAWAKENGDICSVQILSIKTARALHNGNKPLLSEYWVKTTLPDNWNFKRSNSEKKVWYRIDWQQLCEDGIATPVTVVLQSIQMAGEVYVNDQQIWRDQNVTEPLSRSWNRPRYFQLPRSYLREGINTLWIKAISVPGQPLGLGGFYLGDPNKMQMLYDKLIWNSRTVILINIILAVALAIMLFFVWIVDRRQTAYGWYAISIVFWLIFISNFLATSAWPFSNSYVIARVNTIALLLTTMSFSLFILRFAKQRLFYVECIFWLVIEFLVVLTWFIADINLCIAQVLSLIIGTFIFLFACIQPLCFGLRQRQKEIVFFALGWLLVLGAYIYDLLLLLNLVFNPIALTSYVSIFVTLYIICIIGWRHAHYIKQIASFNDELSISVTRAKRELSVVLEQEYALSMENTRLQDRLQIANDLHDGLGGSLVHLMASVEMAKPFYSSKEVIAMLSLIRNDLRQAIDSSSSQSVKVPETPHEWLAQVRHRYSTLFEELGLEFKWYIERSWKTVPTAIQCLALTRLIEEALTNVIKHSHAHFVEISLKLPKNDVLILTIEDNGLGFDVEAVAQSGMSIGMRSMKMRISRVGGHLEVLSRPGKTTLIATLNL